MNCLENKLKYILLLVLDLEAFLKPLNPNVPAGNTSYEIRRQLHEVSSYYMIRT